MGAFRHRDLRAHEQGHEGNHHRVGNNPWIPLLCSKCVINTIVTWFCIIIAVIYSSKDNFLDLVSLDCRNSWLHLAVCVQRERQHCDSTNFKFETVGEELGGREWKVFLSLGAASCSEFREFLNSFEFLNRWVWISERAHLNFWMAAVFFPSF